MLPTNWLQAAGHDIRLSIRGWRHARGYAAVVILTFALGIGVNAAVFSVLDAALFRAAPFEDANRLLQVFEEDGREGRRYGRITIADLNDWRDQATLFEGIAGVAQNSATLQTDGATSQLSAASVSADFFRVLKVRARLGREFLPEDAVPGAAPVAILSSEAAQRLFGSESVVGRRVRLDDRLTEIIGVLPPRMPNPIGSPVEVWRASDFSAIARDPQRARRMHFLQAVGRVRSDASVDAARAQLRAIGQRLALEYPQLNSGHAPNPVPLQYDDSEAVRGGLIMLMAAAVCVLLIACANIANVTLARSLARVREFSVRAALGSSHAAMVRQMLVEQLCLAAAGAVAGLLAAQWTLNALTGIERFGIPRADQIQIDARVIVFAFALILPATLLSGLVPAILVLRRNLFGELRTGGHGATLTRGGHRVRGGLVASQVGVATVLLFACALALRSLGALLSVDTGFDTRSVWRFSAVTPATRYPEPAAVLTFQRQLLERLRSVPGVAAASVAYAPPMENVSSTAVAVEGSSAPPPEIGYNAADGDYFRTLDIPLLAGRLMDARDVASAPPVVVINRVMAEQLWPGRSAVGQRVRASSDASSPWTEVIGVVGDIRRQSVEQPPGPEMYFPLTQDISRGPVYVVRLGDGASPPIAAIRSIVHELNPAIAVTGMAPLAATLEERSLSRPGFIARLLTAFGGVALVLATIGTYGVIAALVAERRREIGVRKALGAQSGLVQRDALRRGMTPVVAGVVLGGLGALAAGRILASGFYGVSARDPVALAAVTALLLLSGLAGCLGPAKRAARMEPSLLLREYGDRM